MITKQVKIRNESGFHIRPAQLFSEKAAKYKSVVHIQPEGKDAKIDGKSILGLMTLGLGKGDVVSVTVDGSDEAEAVAALVELIEGGFGEG